VLAFLDVDGLKRVNDEHGHEVGDLLIKDVAYVLGDTLCESDILARLGGDEFCIMVTESASDATTLRERIAVAFRRFNETSERPYRLSASIGVARAPATGPTTTVDELLAQADEAMYEEKKTNANSRVWVGQV
jgi:diguanylate cyclase (GGDEF)-like protein